MCKRFLDLNFKGLGSWFRSLGAFYPEQSTYSQIQPKPQASFFVISAFAILHGCAFFAHLGRAINAYFLAREFQKNAGNMPDVNMEQPRRQNGRFSSRKYSGLFQDMNTSESQSIRSKLQAKLLPRVRVLYLKEEESLTCRMLLNNCRQVVNTVDIMPSLYLISLVKTTKALLVCFK